MKHKVSKIKSTKPNCVEFAYSAAAVQYGQRKVTGVQPGKVTLVQNSDHLSCHLTCTFLFIVCLSKNSTASSLFSFVISTRFHDGLTSGIGVTESTVSGCKLLRTIW